MKRRAGHRQPLAVVEVPHVHAERPVVTQGLAGRIGADSEAARDRSLHGEQDLQLFQPLPTPATLVAVNRVVSITDKGEGKGAVLAQKVSRVTVILPNKS